MTITIPEFGKDTRVKDIIIEILSTTYPVSAKKLHATIIKKHNLGITYQATHKAIQQLLDSAYYVHYIYVPFSFNLLSAL